MTLTAPPALPGQTSLACLEQTREISMQLLSLHMVPLVSATSVALGIRAEDTEASVALMQVFFKLAAEGMCGVAVVAQRTLILTPLAGQLTVFVL